MIGACLCCGSGAATRACESRAIGSRASNDESEGIHVSALARGGDGSTDPVVGTPARVRISGNDIDVAEIGIFLENVGSFVEVEHNRVLGRHRARGIVVILRNDTVHVHQGLRIADNTITDFARTAIDVARGSSTETIAGLFITGNRIAVTEGPTDGLVAIALRSDHGDQQWTEQPIIAGNSISPNIPIKVSKGPGVVVTTVAGNANHVAIYEGDGHPNTQPAAEHSPEGHVIGVPGSIFLQNDPQPATLYYKAEGTAETGWRRIELSPTS